jgi:hypothetical protein
MAKSTAPKTELSTEIKSFHQGSQPQVPTNFGTTKPTPIVMTVDWKSALKARIEMLKAGQQISPQPSSGIHPLPLRRLQRGLLLWASFFLKVSGRRCCAALVLPIREGLASGY